MMTEEDKRAWNSITDEAAQYVVSAVTHAAGETLLRGALRKLMGFERSMEGSREGLIYQALMAASDAGYRCGIRVYDSVGTKVEVTAFIELPHGVVGMPLEADYGTGYIAYDNHALAVVRLFLGD